MLGAAAFLGDLALGDFGIAFPLSDGRIQRCSAKPEPDESESYLKLRKFRARVFALFREDETPREQGSGVRGQGSRVRD
jgi:hypothetical protein